MGNTLYSRTFRRGLFDFHAGEAVPEVELDTKAYFAAASEAGIQTITFMTKDAFGTSYYDTRIGHKNSKLKGDLLAAATQEAKKYNIDIIAYYNVGLNSYVAQDNPDYRQRTADGNPVTGAFDYYDILCMNSPYRDFVYGQLAEIAENYEVAGFFFDITYVWEGCCYCEYCHQLYLAKFGRRMPNSPQPGSVEQKQWQSFQREIRFNFLRDAVSLLKRINPDLLVGWNHAGDPIFGQVEADQFADYFTSEFHPPHYKFGSLLARWKRSLRKPFELMMPSEMGSWGEWTVAPAATLQTMAAIAVAGGGSISFGHVAYPSGLLKGQVPAAVMTAIAGANNAVKALEPWLLGAESVPMVAVLHAIGNKRMMESSAMEWQADLPHLQGIHRILTEGHIHFDIIDEQALIERIELYNVLILPDQAYLDETVQARIRAYVLGGGRVIASGRTSLYGMDGLQQPDFGLADVFGVHFAKQSIYSVSYFYPIGNELRTQMPDLPILLKSPGQYALEVKADANTRELSGFVAPAVEAKAFRHVYHQHAHPAYATSYPAITVHDCGAGSCAYIAGPIEASYWSTGSPWLRNLYLNLLRELDPDPALTINAPMSIEVSVMRQPSRLIVHLVNAREELAAGSKGFIEQIAPVVDVKVAIKGSATDVYLAPEGTRLDYTVENECVRFTVPRIDIHAAVVIEQG